MTPEGAGAGYAFVDDEDDVAVRASGRSNTGGAARFSEPAEFSPAQQGSTRHSAPQSGEFAAPAARAAPAPAPQPTANPAFEEDDDELPAPAQPQRQVVEEDEDEVAPPPVPKKATVTKKTVQTKLVAKAK